MGPYQEKLKLQCRSANEAHKSYHGTTNNASKQKRCYNPGKLLQSPLEISYLKQKDTVKVVPASSFLMLTWKVMSMNNQIYK